MRKADRKQRTDAWYANIISDTDMWAAYDACKRMRPWNRAAAWILDKHNIRVSRSAYYRWMDWCRANELTHTIQDAKRFADETKRIISEVGDVDVTLQEGISALALDAASARDMGTLGDLVSGLGKLRKADVERLQGEVKTLKAKIADLETANAEHKSAPALSPEEKDRRIKEIYGL